MFCSSCGKEQPEGAKFCRECGKPMVGAQPSPSAEAPPSMAAPTLPVSSPGDSIPPYAAVKPRRNKTPIIVGLAALAVVAIVVVVLVVTLGGGGGDGGGVAGRYKSTSSGLGIELKSDGTYDMLDSNEEVMEVFGGTYEISGDKIEMRIESDYGDIVNEGTIKDGKIEMNGEVYVKE